jgi:DDE family transposase
MAERDAQAKLGLGFEYEQSEPDERVTARAGIPLLVDAFRALGLAQSARDNLHLKQRQRGLDEAQYVESFVILNASGGECLDDFAQLRQDHGLEALIGYQLPSPEAARKFLNQFHDEEKIEQARGQLALGEVSYIPGESQPLRCLGHVNEDLIEQLSRRCPEQRIATIDLDSTVIESWKRQAQATYQGGSGYQPLLALWAEMNVIVAEEFRDGNVPAQQEPLRVARRAFRALPLTVREYYFRGDSACYEKQLLNWLRDEQREDGPAGPIRFAISVRMHRGLKEAIQQLPAEAWQPYREDHEVTAECAELSNYWPETGNDKAGAPLRHVAIRIRKRQGEMFGDGSESKHFAVVTNVWDWKPRRLLEWHREKAGSIEAVHDILKNELAAGVLPCGRFGANAAWLRLAVITHNVLSALKRIALPPELLNARPKRMRFLIFNTVGRIVQHAHRTICRVAGADWQHWRRLLFQPALG